MNYDAQRIWVYPDFIEFQSEDTMHSHSLYEMPSDKKLFFTETRHSTEEQY